MLTTPKVGCEESLAPRWAEMRKKIDLEEPTPLIDQVDVGCTQRAATVDEETITTKTELLQNITTSHVDQNTQEKAHNAEKCVERNCELTEKSVS